MAHCNWIVAFLDILGQKDDMEQIDFVDSKMTGEKRVAFETGVKKVYGTTRFLHDTIHSWVERSKGNLPPAIREVSTDETVWTQMNSGMLKTQRFSDGLIVFATLCDPAAVSPLKPMFFLLGCCANVMAVTLARGTPIRGGIAIGAGVEMRPNELYGPVLARAHRLESEIAQHPRIVLDKRSHEFIQRIAGSSGGGARGDADRAVARACADMLRIDVDGYVIVDYLGKASLSVCDRSTTEQVLTMISDFANKEYDKHRAALNTKLAFRYTQLLNYIEFSTSEFRK